ncbi:ribosomal maturation YjgA family protein [Spirosoma pollinicola]|nr:DUF2809 domain-containing protein [Spirosoma pollinicola]
MTITLLLGLGSRYFFGEIAIIKNYIGDVLWALMVYFGFALLFNKWPVKVIALTAIAFSFSIEISQLYHAFWIDSLRATRLGGLMLGFSFVWSDLPCYCMGVLIGVLVDLYLIRAAKQGGHKQSIRA